jgi:hypothetical protein
VGGRLLRSTTINPIGEFLDAFERPSINKIYSLNENLFTNEKSQEKYIPPGENCASLRVVNGKIHPFKIPSIALEYGKTEL